MKNITLTLLTAIVLLIFTGCDKYHRNKYVGDWDFVTERSTTKRDNLLFEIIEENRSVIYYSGKISLGNSENELLIKYTEDDEIIAWLEQNSNEIYTFSEASFTGKYPSGKFDGKNNMQIYFSWFKKGNEGVHIIGCADCINGTKKKGGKK